MPWNVEWSENSVLSVKQTGQVTLEDITAMNNKIVTELNSVTAPNFIIWDVSSMTVHPSKLKEILDVAQPVLKHEALTAVIFIGLNNPVMKFLTTVVSTIGKLRFHVTEDWSAAQQTLKKLKESYKVT